MSLESITERIRQEAEAYGADQKARAEAAKIIYGVYTISD